MAQPKVFSINVSETTITALKFIGVIALINLCIALVNVFAAGRRKCDGVHEGNHRRITLIPPSISSVDMDEDNDEEKSHNKKGPVVDSKDKPKRKYTKRKKD